MEELSNKEQVELLKKWWHDYGKSILLAIIVGIGAGYGWRYYKEHKAEQQFASAEQYQLVSSASKTKNHSEAIKAANQLIKLYPHSLYATLSRFNLAKAYFEEKKYDEVVANLNWVIKHSNVVSFQEIARLRLARIYVDQKKNQKALALLKNVKDPDFLPAVKVVQKMAAGRA